MIRQFDSLQSKFSIYIRFRNKISQQGTEKMKREHPKYFPDQELF
jgi:hypothetical protein